LIVFKNLLHFVAEVSDTKTMSSPMQPWDATLCLRMQLVVQDCFAG